MKTKLLLLITLLIWSPLMGARLRLPDTPVTFGKLSQELVAAGLPIAGIGRLSREIDSDGRAVLVDKKPVKVPPYLIIKSKEPLTAAQEQQVKDIVAAHVPDPEPTEAEIADARKEAELNRPGMKAFIEFWAEETGQLVSAVKTKIKNKMQ